MLRPLMLLVAVGAPAGAAGCGGEPPAIARDGGPAPVAEPPSTFDASNCGTVTGLVTWVGAVPDVPPALVTVPRADGSGYDNRQLPLGNAPRIDRFTRGMAGAVVFLRGINPTQARAWDLPPVEVAFNDSQLQIKQGDRVGRTGFVKRGDSVTMLSREPQFHSLRGRGAAFFSLAFPDPDKPLTRAFGTCGRVELTSAAGCYWQAADLFVCDHPYYTVTDADGRYRFSNIPVGQYDLVAWHPSWVITRQERNPETTLPFKLYYEPPLESSRPVTVTRGHTTLATLSLPK